MAQLEQERELAVMEQEMMERLKAEEFLFQQVRQESWWLELVESPLVWCNPGVEKLISCA